MADEGAKVVDLSTMFKAKGKKKAPKATNLNTNPGGAKIEEKKDKSKKQDTDWADDDDVQATELKVQALENFKEIEKEDYDTSGTQAWNSIKKQAENSGVNDKKFPSLAKALSANPRAELEKTDVAIKISKNKFDALDDNAYIKSKNTSLAAALVTKAKGERQEDAVKRTKAEIEKSKKQERKRMARENGGGSDTEESEEEEEQSKEDAPKKAPVKKAPVKKAPAKPVAAEEEEEEEATPAAEDTTMEPDLAAARAKYADRKRLPVRDLPFSELQEKRANKVQPKKPAASAGGKKKKGFAEWDEEEENGKKHLQAMPDDW